MVPGMSLAQWISTRLIMQSIRAAVNTGRYLLYGNTAPNCAVYGAVVPSSEEEDELSPAAAYKHAIKTSLLHDDADTECKIGGAIGRCVLRQCLADGCDFGGWSGSLCPPITRFLWPVGMFLP